jgi:sigma-E factor negative regulatory protein RseB
VSMFIEAIDRQRHKKPLLTQVGATHTLMQPHGSEWWITVMGDVPAITLKQFFQALERRP